MPLKGFPLRLFSTASDYHIQQHILQPVKAWSSPKREVWQKVQTFRLNIRRDQTWSPHMQRSWLLMWPWDCSRWLRLQNADPVFKKGDNEHHICNSTTCIPKCVLLNLFQKPCCILWGLQIQHYEMRELCLSSLRCLCFLPALSIFQYIMPLAFSQRKLLHLLP